MLEEVFSYPSADGRTTIHGRRWIPEGKIRGVLQIAHGMCEYIERYEEFAAFLAEKGLLVTGHDHLGHGQSVVSKDDLGFFAEKDGNRAVLEDMHQEYQLTRAWLENSGRGNSETPYILFGHSMGSFVVRCYLTEHSEGMAGAVLSGTGYFPPATVNAGLAMAEAECLAGKKRKESPLINAMAFSSSNKPFAPNRTPFDWLSRDEGEVDKYVADPWCGFMFTAAGYRELFRGLKRLTQEKELGKIRPDLPVLFISGEKDPVGNMGKGVRKVAESFRGAGIRDVEVRLYPECRHELFNELNREEVYADLIAWLERRENGIKL